MRTIRVLVVSLSVASLVAGCSSGNVKSAKDYHPPAAPPAAHPAYDPGTPYGQANAVWAPPVFDRAGTVVKPREPSTSLDRPDYEHAPWATGAAGGSQGAPAGTW